MTIRGHFITLEGIEGSGKTTQLKRLAARLKQSGHNCVTTREPGGTQLAERIRAILLDPQEEGMDSTTELLLYAASRRQHVVELIRPALETGSVVLSDRFTDATLAYQGYGRLLNLDLLHQLNLLATDGVMPVLTLIFDLPETVGIERARARNQASAQLQSEGRLEGEDIKFHRRVREGYLAIAKTDPKRYAVIDASGDLDTVTDRMFATVAKHLPQPSLSDASR